MSSVPFFKLAILTVFFLNLFEITALNDASILEAISQVLKDKLTDETRFFDRGLQVKARRDKNSDDTDSSDDEGTSTDDSDSSADDSDSSTDDSDDDSSTEEEKKKKKKRNNQYPRICGLKANPGPCRAGLTRYYFNKRRKSCSSFKWGGCQGNGNRFDDKRTCQEVCQKRQMLRPTFCYLSFEWGNCFTGYRRFFYDWRTGTCNARLHSGCGGNLNIFDTYSACYNTCAQDNVTQTKLTKSNTVWP